MDKLSALVVPILIIVTPVFGVVFAGWLAERSRYLPGSAATVIAQFSFKIAMPVFLFRAMLDVRDLPEAPWKLLLAYYLGLAIVWIAAALLTRFILGRPAPDGAAVGMGACFGNTVMLGVPLGVSAFGPDAAAPIALLISLDTPFLWIIATLHIEWASQSSRSGSAARAIATVSWDLLRNPIVMSLLFGTLFRISGLQLPGVLDRFTALLGQAAVPSGLFALGMSLAAYGFKGQLQTLAAICILKMALLPAAIFVLAGPVFNLPPLWLSIAVLFAAMPVGANAFLFASKYDRVVGAVSGAIATSTILAVVTVSAILFVLTPK